jgi:hypothetical protein
MDVGTDMTDNIEMVKIERDALASVIKDLQQECIDLTRENMRLTDIVLRMKRIYEHLNPENNPGVCFIHQSLGQYDQNGMPEKLLVVPSYGCDFSYVYERTEKTTGPEW